MAATKKECAYVKCDKHFYGGKRALYCLSKCGTYQWRLNQKASVVIDGAVYCAVSKQVKKDNNNE